MAEFYRRVFTDELLGPVFVDVARVDLAVHLPVMCDFWQTVLLHAGLYRRNALRPHVDLTARIELSPAHFTRWLSLWTATVDERHTVKRRSSRKSRPPVSAARSVADLRRVARSVPIGISPPDPRLP